MISVWESFSLYLYSGMYKQSMKIFLAKFPTNLHSSSPANVSSGIIYTLIYPFVISKQLFQHAEQRNVWRIFVETLPAGEPV